MLLLADVLTKEVTVDTDPNITVGLHSDSDEDYCLEIVIGWVVVSLHARSAIDLHHKLGLAIADWFGVAAATLFVQEAIKENK
jgi:hypothetical protein